MRKSVLHGALHLPLGTPFRAKNKAPTLVGDLYFPKFQTLSLTGCMLNIAAEYKCICYAPSVYMACI